MSANYYSQIENGHRLPQLEHLLKLRNIFNVSLADIFLNSEIANCDNKGMAIKMSRPVPLSSIIM
ncbi:helix-turn-helix domain-containing protein [Siminovitchia terrae]|uniref:helix-turn-helix domain-containing protein n=1 Tax=Siminovitchia terrae TaxID=1914933 RepID=UPI001BB4334E